MSDDRSTDDAVSSPNTEITALAQRVATARGILPLQHDTALYDALSDAEIRAERELAEWIRKQRREQRRRAVGDELAAEKRDRRTGALIRRTDEADARWHRKALAARRRVSSADARLAQLYRRAEWSSRALIGVVVLGMVWAGINVQHNLVPSGDMSDPLYWLSFGIEAMISIPIIVIMVAATTAARWGRELERGKVLFFELALLGTTVALNAGPHLAAGAWGRAAEYSIAPVMVGVVIWLHAWVSARYALLIESASVELPGDTSPNYAMSERVPDASHVPDTRMAAPTEAVREQLSATPADKPGVDAEHTAPVTVGTSTPSPAAIDTTARNPAAMGTPRPEVAAAERAGAMPGTTEEPSASADVVVGEDIRPVTERPEGIGSARIPYRDEVARTADEIAATTNSPGATGTAATARIHATAVAADPAATATPEQAVPQATRTDKPIPATATARLVTDDRGPLTTRRPSTAPGTLELIHKAAAEDRRTGDRARGAAPTLRRIPVTAGAQATAGDTTGTDPVPEATAHADTVARDRNGDTTAPAAAIHTDPLPQADEPEQLTLATELESGRTQHVRTDPAKSDTNQRTAHSDSPTRPAEPAVAPPPARTDAPSAAAAERPAPTDAGPAPKPRTRAIPVDTSDAAPAPDPAPSPDPIEPDRTEDDPTDDYFDEDNEVRALARQIAHRSPLRLTLDQIEEILELTDQSWSARSIGAEVGVSGSTVTNIVEFARKIRQPYAFTG
ncbi:helix-turn-helix domain-containing protein [Nocardia rhizosphaerae]|uniref:Uncharacterized protein n=1 Tax=Nocardia rhizosphaerae TaxID=1691571 RepID=A0ABV8L343_9NOCA